MKMILKQNFLVFFALINIFCQTEAENRKEYEMLNEIEEDFEVSFRMVGGDSVVDRTKWPWLVAFTHNEGNNYFCGGSLISKRHVLSGKKK